MKHPPEFYNKKYLKSVMGDTAGGNRWEDNGAFFNAAVFTHAFATRFGLLNGSFLDVGCGRGFTVKHLLNLNLKAEGCEYGTHALKSAVIDQIKWADLTEILPYEDGQFDFVSCVGVLSQFGEEHAPRAVEELCRVSRAFVWVNILTVPSEDQAHHLNVQGDAYWGTQFEDKGMRLFHEADGLIEKFFTQSPTQFKAVWKKD